MRIAVVILNWNGKALLEEFLPSVVQYSRGAQVYVADNASTDNSLDYLNKNFPSVKIIRNRANYGFAKGYNEALKNLKEEFFVLLNSDVEVTKNWLQPLLSYMVKHDEVGILQPKILSYRKKNYFEYSGAGGGFVDRLGYPFCRGRIFDHIEEDTGQYDTPRSILWASGACLMIRSDLYKDLGGMDADYFAHQEEIDLCWRAFNAGYRAFVIPDSVVYHLGGATLKAGNPQKTFLNFRNSLYNLLKNTPNSSRRWLLLSRMSLDGLAGFKFLLEGKPEHTWAIIRAHFSFYKNYGKIRRKRGRQKRFRKDYFLIKSVAWQYFFCKKLNFNELEK